MRSTFFSTRCTKLTHTLFTLLLAPLLILQAYKVKRTVPRLPEAKGARVGQLGQGKPLRLLLLGDSATAGVGVKTQTQALTGQLTKRLASDYRVTWQLVAKTGYTLSTLLAQSRCLTPQPFDIVIIAIGVNDVTKRTSLTAWVDAYKQLITTLKTYYSPKTIILVAIPPMQYFPALPQPLRWFLGKRAARLNTALQRLALDYPYCEFAPMPAILKSELMASDGFHPGALGYALWAEQLANLIIKITKDNN